MMLGSITSEDELKSEMICVRTVRFLLMELCALKIPPC